MAHNKAEVVVGGAVLAAAIAFAVFAAQKTGFGSATGAGYALTASFRSLVGVNVGTDVRLAGVKVGAVTDIRLNPETFRADTTLSVQEGIQIPEDSAVVISSEGLLGGNFVEIMPGGSPFNLAAGAEIEDTQGAVSLISLLLKYVGSGGGATQ